jgi:MtN3 and saliva related transmembrane protein
MGSRLQPFPLSPMLSWRMNFVSLVGFGAGTLCTLAYLPQALHSFRTKSVRDISLIMLVSLNVGLLLWVTYGFLIHSLPIILPNAVTFFLAFPLLVMKLRYRGSHTV